jgi:hypothetical protein
MAVAMIGSRQLILNRAAASRPSGESRHAEELEEH